MPGKRAPQPHGGAIDNEPWDEIYTGPRAIPQLAEPPALPPVLERNRVDRPFIHVPGTEPPPPRVPLSLLTVERRAYVELLWRMRYDDDEIADIIAGHFCAPHRRETDLEGLIALIKRDVAATRDKYAAIEADPDVLKARRAKMIASLEWLFRECVAIGDRKQALATLKELSKIEGLYAPIKIENTTTQQTASVDFDKVLAALDEKGVAAFELVMQQLEAVGISVRDQRALTASTVVASPDRCGGAPLP